MINYKWGIDFLVYKTNLITIYIEITKPEMYVNHTEYVNFQSRLYPTVK